jgi:hypothetical protein
MSVGIDGSVNDGQGWDTGGQDYLDGNALAGPLAGIAAGDLTTAVGSATSAGPPPSWRRRASTRTHRPDRPVHRLRVGPAAVERGGRTHRPRPARLSYLSIPRE